MGEALSADVTWSPPTQSYLPILNYEITYKKTTEQPTDINMISDTDFDQAKFDTAAADATNFKIKNLNFNVKYEFFVRAVTLEGKGSWSMVGGKTKNISKPSKVNIIRGTDGNGIQRDGKRISFNITVDIGGGNLKALYIQSEKNRTENNGMTQVIPEEAASAKADVPINLSPFKINVESLTPSTKYTLCVIVKNEAGNSSQTQTCDFTKQNKTDNPKECSCLIVKTAEAAANRKIISKGMTTTQLLLITGLVLLIMLVVIDLSCHYMNECGIFSTILKARENFSNRDGNDSIADSHNKNNNNNIGYSEADTFRHDLAAENVKDRYSDEHTPMINVG